MPELFDTSSVRDDAATWDTKARGVMDALHSRRNGIDTLGENRAAWLAASLAVAASILLLIVPLPLPSGARAEALLPVIVPSDASGRAIVLPDHPPALGALILTDAFAGDAR